MSKLSEWIIDLVLNKRFIKECIFSLVLNMGSVFFFVVKEKSGSYIWLVNLKEMKPPWGEKKVPELSSSEFCRKKKAMNMFFLFKVP